MSAQADNSEVKLELHTAFMDAGFSSAQASCPADILASELSTEDVSVLSDVVREGVAEFRSNNPGRELDEPEKSQLLAEVVESIPLLQVMSGFFGDTESRIKASGAANATDAVRIQSAVSRDCGWLFADPGQDYYLTLVDGEMRYHKRSEVDFDREFYASSDGMARCVKVFRSLAGGNPNEGLTEAAKVEEHQLADAQRAVFLTKQLVDGLGKDADQAGKALHETSFVADKKVEHECRASFPDEEMYMFMAGQVSNQNKSFANDIKAVYAAESELNRRNQ